MPKVTALQIQKNNANRYNVYVDGIYYCALDFETVIKCRIKEGQNIEYSDLDAAQEINERSVALNRAADYLSRGLKTKMQTIIYLQGKGYTGKTIGYVIDKLQEYGYVNDEYYAKAYIHAYKDKKGKVYIRTQLIKRGVDRNIFEPLLEETGDQTEQAYAVCVKYLKGKPAATETTRKAYRYILQKGFSYSEADSAISRYKEEYPCEEQ